MVNVIGHKRLTERGVVNVRPHTRENPKEFVKRNFPNFNIIDEDEEYLYLKKPNVGVVEARINKGSLGSYDVKYVVEKFGERNKLFSGKDVEKRINKYLES